MKENDRRNANSAGSASELTGWALVILGAALAIVAGRQVAGLFDVQSTWVETPATVVRTRLGTTDTVGRAGAEVRVFKELVYFVKGNRYQESLEVGRFATAANAREFLSRSQRAGTETLVWVDSRNPSNVKTKPTERTASAWSTAIFALLGLFSVQAGSSLISAAARKGRAVETTRVGAEAIASH